MSYITISHILSVTVHIIILHILYIQHITYSIFTNTLLIHTDTLMHAQCKQSTHT